MLKTLVLGANGQLGSDLIRVLADWNVIASRRSDIELCDHVATRQKLSEIKPNLVINTAAFHKLDDCEDQPEKAFTVNALAVRNLAQTCAELRCTLVHMSTDYVFGGDKRTPYTESDLPNPLNVYGVSKIAGEHFVRTHCPKHFVVRTTGLYGVAGSSGKGGNFVELMIRLAKEGRPIRVVSDQVLTPTSTMDLSVKLKELVLSEAYGLYHVTSSSSCSWYEFAGKIFALTGLRPDLEPTTTMNAGAKVQRPAYSVLEHVRLRKTGLPDMRPWPEALAAYLTEKGHIA